MTQISSSQLPSSALVALGAVAEVLVPGDDGYAETAAILFADGTPDLVVRPDAAGVAAALRYAADAGLAVTVRSGGHSMAGLSTSADGMIIDTRRISGVRLLDPAAVTRRYDPATCSGAPTTSSPTSPERGHRCHKRLPVAVNTGSTPPGF